MNSECCILPFPMLGYHEQHGNQEGATPDLCNINSLESNDVSHGPTWVPEKGHPSHFLCASTKKAG